MTWQPSRGREYLDCLDCGLSYRAGTSRNVHIAVCPDCARRWEEIEVTVLEALDSLPEDHSPAEFDARCAEIIEPLGWPN